MHFISSVDSQLLKDKEVKMQVKSLFYLLLSFYGVWSINIAPNINNRLDPVDRNEPRIFFRQMIEASGLFPIEINVPDMVSSMASGMNWMYESVSTYFNGQSQAEGSDETQSQQVSYDEVVQNSQPSNERHRKKKVRRVKKKTDSNGDENMFDLLFEIINFFY